MALGGFVSYSLDLQQKIRQNQKQLQHLIMSRQMQQAIHLLQMPLSELSPLVELEVQQNPVLEYLQENEQDDDQALSALEEENKEEVLDKDQIPEAELDFDEHDFEIMRRLDEDFRDLFSEGGGYSIRRSSEQEKLQNFLENSIPEESTQFEYLMKQAQEAFKEKEEISIAESIIGSLDENGFLGTPLQELSVLQECPIETLEKVLTVIQTFHPPGIAARDLRECLLIQLKLQGKEKTLAYQIVDQHFDDLLQNRISMIKKELRCTSEEIREMIDHHIAHLELHPGALLYPQKNTYIYPDITFNQEGDEIKVSVNEDSIPSLRLNRRYLRMLDQRDIPKETQDFIKHRVVSAKWFLRNILQRNDTLEKIGKSLAKWHRDFFLIPEGKLVPLTMKTVAEELQLHESTIARAVANKYADTPRGLLPLRSFFTNGLMTQEGQEVSTKTVKDMLQEIIDKENKKKPLSDEAISKAMKDLGIECARRTVAKYRDTLNIGNAQQRKKF